MELTVKEKCWRQFCILLIIVICFDSYYNLWIWIGTVINSFHCCDIGLFIQNRINESILEYTVLPAA